MLLGFVWEASSGEEPLLPTLITINALVSFDVLHFQFSSQYFYQLSLYLAASQKKISNWFLMSSNNSLLTSIFKTFLHFNLLKKVFKVTFEVES